MIRVVLDTNIVVSACLTPAGSPATILELALLGAFTLYVSPHVLAEYREVLAREKFSREKSRIDTLLEGVEEIAIRIVPKRTLAISRDDGDNRLLECAESAAADFLITGNLKDFPESWESTRIVSPSVFLAEFRF